MEDDRFKNFGGGDSAAQASKSVFSVLDAQRASRLTQLASEISVWALKEQARMEQELTWLRMIQKTAGLSAVRADLTASSTRQLASQVDNFYKELP